MIRRVNAGIAAATGTTEQDPKDRELAALPVGIKVSHSPNPVTARAGGRSGRRYTWLHETHVSASAEDVSILEFGAITRNPARGNRWELQTIYDRPFTASELQSDGHLGRFAPIGDVGVIDAKLIELAWPTS